MESTDVEKARGRSHAGSTSRRSQSRLRSSRLEGEIFLSLIIRLLITITTSRSFHEIIVIASITNSWKLRIP
jgi:hypothetical protein